MFMRLPINTDDKQQLAAYLRMLINEGRTIEFYKSDDWIELRTEVYQEQHGECQKCKEEGDIVHATQVHHVKEVKDFPELALSKTYIDQTGLEQKQLVLSCLKCHNIEHNRFSSAEDRTQLNEERW